MTLIKTKAELQAAVRSSTGLEIETIAPFLTNSEAEQEVIKILGQQLYDTLVDHYNDDILSGPEQALLPFVQKPLANLAIYQFLQFGGMTISDAGVTLSTNREQAAFQWQQLKAERAFLKDGYITMESLLSYLEAHKVDFPGWGNGTQYPALKEFFINTALEFQSYVNINRSRRTLTAMAPVMRNVEAFEIESLLTGTLFNAIKAEILAGSVSADNQALLSYIKPAVAHLTIAQAASELSMEITPEGAFIYTITASGASQIQKYAEADPDRLARHKTHHENVGKAYLQKLRAYLNATASSTKYAAYFASTNYEDPTTTSQTYEQDPETKIFNAL
jgi:hypothetical protein